jgi:hypothetical protein
VVFPGKRIFEIYMYMQVGKRGKEGRKRVQSNYMRTVRLLCDFAFFCERDEGLLRRCLRDGALEVGRDVDGTVRTVYLTDKVRNEHTEKTRRKFTHPFDIIEDFILRFGKKGRDGPVYQVAEGAPSCPLRTLTSDFALDDIATVCESEERGTKSHD